MSDLTSVLTRLASGLLLRLQVNAHAVWSPTALGVLGALCDEAGRVLLVRNRYQPGWCLPGGGVGRGEAPQIAVLRELAEEVGLRGGTAELFGLYTRGFGWATNTVALYRITGTIDFRPSLEIAEICFADPRQPPPGTTAGTVRRLRELCGGAALSPYW